MMSLTLSPNRYITFLLLCVKLYYIMTAPTRELDPQTTIMSSTSESFASTTESFQEMLNEINTAAAIIVPLLAGVIVLFLLLLIACGTVVILMTRRRKRQEADITRVRYILSSEGEYLATESGSTTNYGFDNQIVSLQCHVVAWPYN